MHRRTLLPLAVLATLAGPAVARADFPHVVAPSESLSSVASADGLSVSELAAANGLPVDAQLIAGTVLQIPPPGTVAGTSSAAPPSAAPAPSGSSGGGGDGDNDADDSAIATATPPVTRESSPPGDGDSDSDDVSVATPPASAVTTPVSSSGYVVVPGDTLSGIAARAGVSVSELAAANGIDPNAPLLSGTVLSVSGASSSTSVMSSSQPVGSAAEGSAGGPPYPTPERVTAGQVGQVASANGVPPSLAAAVGWQESGFNNALVSSADARGVMQILPGTWAWIQQDLTPAAPLAPASAVDNVRGGVLLLHWLLASTGGDPGLAAAGYFQGLPSVRRYGVLPATQQYVNDVLALRQQFGGP